MAHASAVGLARESLVPSLRRGEAKLSPLFTETVRLRAAEKLIAARTQHSFVYRVRSGWLCRVRDSADGREQIILSFLPGDLFAVKSLFLRTHPDSVIALSDCEVERVHYLKLLAALENDSDIANRCTWQVVEEERRLHNWIFGLGQGSAEERMALLLHELLVRLRRAHAIEPDALSFSFPMSQQQVAEHLGITVVHVNRVLRSFREREVVTIRGREVVIHALAELRRIAAPMLDEYDRLASDEMTDLPGAAGDLR